MQFCSFFTSLFSIYHRLKKVETVDSIRIPATEAIPPEDHILITNDLNVIYCSKSASCTTDRCDSSFTYCGCLVDEIYFGLG